MQNLDIRYNGAVSVLALEAASDHAGSAESTPHFGARVRRAFIKHRATKMGPGLERGQKSFIKRRKGLRVLPVEDAIFGNTRDLTDEDVAGFDFEA